MNNTNDEQIENMLNKSFRRFAEHERRWWSKKQRGRWVVIETGPGRLLTRSPQHIRDYVDAISELRGRRFSSLSRARRFAREVGGVVRRWHRQMSGCRTWRFITNPWERTRGMLCSPLIYAFLPSDL